MNLFLGYEEIMLFFFFFSFFFFWGGGRGHYQNLTILVGHFYPFLGQDIEWEYFLGPQNFKYFLSMPNIPDTLG